NVTEASPPFLTQVPTGLGGVSSPSTGAASRMNGSAVAAQRTMAIPPSGARGGFASSPAYGRRRAIMRDDRSANKLLQVGRCWSPPRPPGLSSSFSPLPHPRPAFSSADMGKIHPAASLKEKTPADAVRPFTFDQRIDLLRVLPAERTLGVRVISHPSLNLTL